MSFPEEALRLRLSEALGRELLGESTHELHRAMTHALLAGGKRLRPMLTCLWGQRYGAHEDDLIQAGLAVEWVHTYSLVHDDLPCMDDDDLRRGQPTVHKVFGEAMGVLCGDALLTDAFAKLAALEHTSAERRLAAIARLARGAGSQGMVLGQVEDLAAAARTTEQVLEVHSKKTGCLLRAASAVVRCSAVHHWTSWLESSGLAAILRWRPSKPLTTCSMRPVRPRRWVSRSAPTKRDLPTLVGLLGPVGCRALIEDETNKALALLDLEQPDEAPGGADGLVDAARSLTCCSLLCSWLSPASVTVQGADPVLTRRLETLLLPLWRRTLDPERVAKRAQAVYLRSGRFLSTVRHEVRGEALTLSVDPGAKRAWSLCASWGTRS